jgi:hypothetical protein
MLQCLVLISCHGRGRGFEPRRPRQILKDLSPFWHVASKYKIVQHEKTHFGEAELTSSLSSDVISELYFRAAMATKSAAPISDFLPKRSPFCSNQLRRYPMQFSRSLSVLTVLLLATSAALLAQTVGRSSGQVAHIGSPVANSVPWTLNRTTTIVQTLANGTTITRTFTVKEARDSEGRTYSETQQTLHVRADGQPTDLVTHNVFDPVARTRITWENRTKIANVTHTPAAKAMQDGMQSMQLRDGDAARKPQGGRPTQHQTSEDLGVRTIAGIEAKGTRSTGIIPAGDWGNDRPLTMVRESWVSTQYNIPLLTITDDPRTGKRTDEITEFQPGEPDPALFQIPSGYTVRESGIYP